MAWNGFDWEQEHIDGSRLLGEAKAELQALREKLPPYDGIRDLSGSMRDIAQLTEAVLLEIQAAQQKVQKAQSHVNCVKLILRGNEWLRGR